MIYVICCDYDSYVEYLKLIPQVDRYMIRAIYTSNQLRGVTINRTKDQVVFLANWMLNKQYMDILRNLSICIEEES